ncbi:hypothetical protein [Desulfonatronum thioautotrophicum]|uniref:hypothetical protein n=1 Tax=Desulfonatronum thioautotrophicum TaxID=617001 RepID=UPI0013792FD4|nr:hypothetical protein [Desulfonatronum thioautotrophicum]
MIQKEIQRRVRVAGCEGWTRTTYWADEPLESGFWTSLAMTGLMSVLGQGRIVVVRRANALTVKLWSDLEPLLRKSKPLLWTFFCLEGEWKGKSPPVPAVLAKQPFFRAAQQRQWVWQSPGMTPQSLRAELKSWATRQGITFASNVGERLAALLPLDGARFGNELQKLELALGDRRRVEISDLGLLGEPTILDNFTFLRGILQSPANLDVWQTVLLDRETSSSGMLMPVLGLLQREMRILWLLNAGEDGAVSLPPSLKSEKKRLAATMGEAGIARIIECVFQAESDLKSGNKQDDQILEFLASSLSSTSGLRP